MIHSVNDETSWLAWNGTDDILITSDFELTTDAQLTLGSSATIRGEGKTITINIAGNTFSGLFDLDSVAAGTYLIENLFVDFNCPGTCQIAVGGLVASSISSNSYALTINKVKISGDFIIVTNQYSGAMLGQHLYGTISNSIVEGGSMGVIGCGYFIGRQSGLLTIYNCFSTGDISTVTSGGIVGSYASGNVTIYNCYSTGNIIVDGGGITGSFFSGVIENCYSTGNLTYAGGSGIARSTTNAALIKNCYALGSLATGTAAITAYVSASTNIENCFGLEATALVAADDALVILNDGTMTDNGFGSGTWDGSDLLNSYDSYTNIWSDTDLASPPMLSAPFILTSFTEGIHWDHTTYDDVDNFIVILYVEPTCFVAGTLILTPIGPVAIEKLDVGDLILTSDNREVEIMKIIVDECKILFKIPKDCFAKKSPSMDLVLTGNHLFKPQNSGWDCCYSTKNKLIERLDPKTQKIYNLQLPCYSTDLLIANGLKCDSAHNRSETIYRRLPNKLMYVMPHSLITHKKFIYNNDIV